MKGITKKWWFWAVVVVLVFLIIRFFTSKTINGSRGGILEGNSHEDGGIKTRVATGQNLELEGGEAVINKYSMTIKDKVVCEGDPKGVASAVNELGGGVKFGEGVCYLK